MKYKKKTYKTWEHSGWGNRLEVSDLRQVEVVIKKRLFRRNIKGNQIHASVDGHLDRIPHVGDQVQTKMKSGKIALFEMIEVRPCGDPTDMFFGKAKALGYLIDGKLQEELG